MKRFGGGAAGMAWLVWATAVVFGPGVARPEEQPGGDSKNTREEFVRLPHRYTVAKDDLDRKGQLVRRALELGPRGIKRLRPRVEADFRGQFKKYKQLFATQAAKERKVNEEKDLDAPTVLDANEALTQRRERLLGVAKLLDSLIAASRTEEFAKRKPRPLVDAVAAFETAMVAWIKSCAGLDKLDTQAAAVIVATNKRRLDKGLPPLAVDYGLCRAAAEHSHDMATHRFFSHTSPIEGRKTIGDRARRHETTALGENIARVRSAAHAMDKWMSSYGHRANILSPYYRRLGVGRSGGHFTQMFGR